MNDPISEGFFESVKRHESDCLNFIVCHREGNECGFLNIQLKRNCIKDWAMTEVPMGGVTQFWLCRYVSWSVCVSDFRLMYNLSINQVIKQLKEIIKPDTSAVIGLENISLKTQLPLWYVDSKLDRELEIQDLLVDLIKSDRFEGLTNFNFSDIVGSRCIALFLRCAMATIATHTEYSMLPYGRMTNRFNKSGSMSERNLRGY